MVHGHRTQYEEFKLTLYDIKLTSFFFIPCRFTYIFSFSKYLHCYYALGNTWGTNTKNVQMKVYGQITQQR